MKTIKTNSSFKDFSGEVMKIDGESIILGTVLTNLMAGAGSNPTLAWQLGKKFATEKTVELMAEEVVFIKKEAEINTLRTNENGEQKGWLAPIIVAQIKEILDSKDEEKKSKK